MYSLVQKWVSVLSGEKRSIGPIPTHVARGPAMGDRRRFQDFLRKQEAATAYKRALADASDSLKNFGSLPVAVRPRPHSALVSKTVPRLVRTRFAYRPQPQYALVHAKQQCRGWRELAVPLRPKCAARVRASEPTVHCCLLAQSTFRSSADGSILLDVSLTHRSAHEETETASARREPSTRSGLLHEHSHSCASESSKERL